MKIINPHQIPRWAVLTPLVLSVLFAPTLWALIEIQPAACGGSRASNSRYIVHETGQSVRVTLRGSTVAEVATVSPTEKSALWVSGRMFGEIPGIGTVSVRISDQSQSWAVIDSQDPQGVDFYPADASQTLYWAFDVLDSAGAVTRTLINLQPMEIAATIQQIPPYGTPFPIANDVVFYDQTDLGTPVFTIVGGESQGILEDFGGLDVRLASIQQDGSNSTFQSIWEIENVSGVPLTIHWFATGIHSAVLTGPSQGYNVPLAAGKTLTVPLDGFFDSGNLDAGVALHATSVPGNNVTAEGHQIVYLQQN